MYVRMVFWSQNEERKNKLIHCKLMTLPILYLFLCAMIMSVSEDMTKRL